MALLLLGLIGTAAGSEGAETGPDSVPVKRGSIVSTVAADGNVESGRELALDLARELVEVDEN